MTSASRWSCNASRSAALTGADMTEIARCDADSPLVSAARDMQAPSHTASRRVRIGTETCTGSRACRNQPDGQFPLARTRSTPRAGAPLPDRDCSRRLRRSQASNASPTASGSPIARATSRLSAACACRLDVALPFCRSRRRSARWRRAGGAPSLWSKAFSNHVRPSVSGHSQAQRKPYAIATWSATSTRPSRPMTRPSPPSVVAILLQPVAPPHGATEKSATPLPTGRPLRACAVASSRQRSTPSFSRAYSRITSRA